MTVSHRFPRDARVRAKADFDRIFKHGRRVALPVLALHWLDAEAEAAASAARMVRARADTPATSDATGGHGPGVAASASRSTPASALPADAGSSRAATAVADPSGAAMPSAADPASARPSAPARPPHPGRHAGAPRLGLAVSRKVDPRAVGRNRIKRALRETFRQHRGQLAPAAYVVVARPGARAMSGAQLASALLGLLRRAGAFQSALPLPPPAGTMPTAACASHDAPPSG